MSERGDKQCSNGVLIRDAKECRKACTSLKIVLGKSKFKTGKACYKAKNGKCRQDGRNKSKVWFVCETSGNDMLHKYITTLAQMNWPFKTNYEFVESLKILYTKRKGRA